MGTGWVPKSTDPADTYLAENRVTTGYYTKQSMGAGRS